MTPFGLLAGTDVLLVGVEDNGDGGLRLYLDARHKGLYALVYDEDVKAEIQRAWRGARGHVTVPMPPPECIYREGEDA